MCDNETFKYFHKVLGLRTDNTLLQMTAKEAQNAVNREKGRKI